MFNSLDLVLQFLYIAINFLWDYKGEIILFGFTVWFISSICKIKEDINDLSHQLSRIENILNPPARNYEEEI